MMQASERKTFLAVVSGACSRPGELTTMANPKSIFITGAASGIGRETALLFAGKGWYVGSVDMNEKGINDLESQLGKDRCFAAVMDVTDPEQVRSVMAAFVKKTGGTLDVLFNNAGLLCFGHFQETDIDFENKMVNVNINGVLNCTKAAIPYLKATPGARLVNMASTSSVYGVPDLSVYAATKHAVCALTEAWDIELEKYGITVSDVLAPFVKTPMLDTDKEPYLIKTMGVKLTPDDIAKTVWQAVHGKKRHWWIGGATYVLFALFWLLPFIKRPVIKKLTVQ